jgi:hypothetical protein
MEVYEITGGERCNPRRFYNASAAIPPLSETLVQGFNMNSQCAEESKEKGEIKIQAQNEEKNLFYDARSEDDEYYWYSSDTFSTKVMKATINEQAMRFYDPSDELSEKAQFGKVFHLTLDYDSFETAREEKHQFIRDAPSINQTLQEMTMLEEIYGYIPSPDIFDTSAFTVRAVHRYRDEDLAQLQPNFAFRPLEVIQKTLQNTTQLAKAVVNVPMTRPLASHFKWLSRFRLRETVCTDTIFSNHQDVNGRTCAQVYYGTKSQMMNIFGMRSKAGLMP